jgi:phospholipid N-methyltransferase
MVEWLDLSQAQAVIEYGTGTGSFTEEITKRRASNCKYVGIEINPVLAGIFRQRFPDLHLYEGSVKDVRGICDAEKIGEVDCIVCGLPWASFSADDQNDFMEAMMSVLKRGGQFVTFAYLQGLLLPAGLRFRKRLRGYFQEVSTSKTVWRNVPPAFVYRCRR